jgi:hypothetical protein
LFDGTGDYLSLTDNFTQSGDFTIEGWIRANATGGTPSIFTIGNESADRVVVYMNGTTISYDTYSGATPDFGTSFTVSTGVWYHLAVVRSGSTITIYRDGTNVGSATKTGTVGNANEFKIGEGWNGYIDEIRVSNSARYTSNFTAPTTPFVSDANTMLLLHTDGTNGSTVFLDDTGVRSPKGIIAIGNAQVSTAQNKFGGASALFDGTDDWLDAVNSSNDWQFSTSSDFTIEGWFYPTAVNNTRVMFSLYDSTTFRASFYLSSGQASFYTPALGAISTGDFPSANVWAHWAITRSSGTTKFWYNGVETASTGTSWDATFTRLILAGENPSGTTVSNDYNGYIDEIRISNSARYTANFTPSTSPFQNNANTVLLIHADGTNGSTSFIDDNSAGIIEEGAAALSVISTIYCVPGDTDPYYIDEGYIDDGYFIGPANASANFVSTISIAVVAGKNQSIDLVSFSFATLSATLNTIKQGASTLSSNSNIFTTVDKIVGFASNFSSNFSLTGDLIKKPGVEVSAIGAFTSQSSVSTNAERLAGLETDLSIDFYIVGDVAKIANASSQLSATFTQTATISHIEGADLFAFTNASIAVQVSRLRDNNIAVSAVFSIAVDGIRIRLSAGDESALFSFTANTVLARSRDYASSQSAAFSLAVDAVKTARASSSLSSQLTQTTLAGKAVIVNANLLSHASIFVSRNAHPRIPIVIDGFPVTSADAAKFGSRSNRVFNLPTKTLSYNQLRVYTNTQFVLQGYHQGGITGAQIFWIGSGGTSDVSNVGNNQFVVNVRLEQLNQQARYKFYLLTRNSSNQSVVFQSGFYTTEASHETLIPLPYIRSSFNQISGSAWNLLALTKDSNNLVSFSINGVTVVSGTVSTIGTATEYRVGWSGVVGGEYRYWDELSLRRGTSGITADAVQNDSTTQAFLYHFEESQDLGFVLPQDDISTLPIAHSGSAGITSVSSISAAIGYRANFFANFVASSSVVAVVTKINEINLVAFDDAELSANVNIFRGYNANCSASASVSATAFRIKQLAADISASATVESTSNRLRDTAISLSNIVTVLATSNVNRNGVADISAISAVTAVIGRLNEINLVAFTDAAVNTTAVKTASAELALEFAFTQLSTAVKTTDTQSNIESVVSQSTAVSALRDAVITTESVSAQISAVARLAGLFADDLCEFNLTTVGVRTASAQSSLQSQSQTEVTAFRIKENPSALESSATLTADAVVVKVVAGSFSSDFAQSAAADRFRSLAMSVVSVSEVSAAGNILGKIECTLFDAVTVNANVEKITEPALTTQTIISTVNADIIVQRNAESSLSVNASQSVVFDRFRNTTATLEVVGSKLVAVVKQAVADIDVNVVSTVSASVEKIAGANADIDTTSSVSATILRLRTTAINTLAVESTVVATGIKQIVEGAAVLQAAAAKLIAIAKTSGNSADVSVTSSVVVAGSVFRGHAADINGVFTQASTASKILSAQSVQSAVSSVSITPTVLIQGNAVISSALQFVVEVREIRLDNIVYVVPGEIRVYVIKSETRIHKIRQETRIYTI